jgi:hypothetical protein
MRRDIRAEITIAVAAVVVLAGGLLFAFVLSDVDETDTPAVSSTASTQVAEASTVTATLTATATDEASRTPVPDDTETATATLTPTNTATDTPQPTETATETATVTATDTPTATQTATSTPDDDARAATADITDTATATVTPSETATPSATTTATATLTPTVAVVTETAPPDVSATSVQPTDSPNTGILPTPPPSPTPQPADAPTRTPATCDLPSGWTTYEVQPGNTLFAIALATRSSLDELRYANCIDDVDTITAGETVYVPRAPVEPVVTTAPSGIRPGLAKIGCDDPRTQITSPIVGQRLSGVFTVYGTATRDEFWYYKIEIRPDPADIYNFYLRSEGRVQNGSLGQVNADVFDSGLHWLRLSVVDLRGGIPPEGVCEVPVYFE